MDFSSGDVAVRHLVAFNSVNLKHTIEFSESTILVVREIKKCVVAVAVAWAAVSVFRGFFDFWGRIRVRRD